MTTEHHSSSDEGQAPLSARDLDRALAFIDGALSPADTERWLAEQTPADRVRFRAMREDAQALRSMHAPEAPEELHEAIMAAAERAELFAGSPNSARFEGAMGSQHQSSWQQGWHSHSQSSSTGVVARPWAMRWRTAASAAALLMMAVAVGWAVWPRGGRGIAPALGPSGVTALESISYSPDHAPYAVVLEFDDVNDAEAVMRSVMNEIPGAHLTCCCRGQCTEIVEGPPTLVGEAGDASELIAIADVPSHQLVIPASELSRVLAAFVGSNNGSVDQRRVQASSSAVHTNGTVELPIFIVPSTR